jgi:hypothetical protein
VSASVNVYATSTGAGNGIRQETNRVFQVDQTIATWQALMIGWPHADIQIGSLCGHRLGPRSSSGGTN